MPDSEPLGPLPPGITGRFVPDVNGLRVHVLEAGQPGAPLILLLHGFPELAYSWRRVMPALAGAGHHVMAPDLRGFGRTTGWDRAYHTGLAPFGLLNLARDAVHLVHALGAPHVALLAGHDAGASVAATCALTRPDLFRAVVLMSAPFPGPPRLPLRPGPDIPGALAQLNPPMQHYQWYYATPHADAELTHPPQGLHAFLRAYYHMKSADWPGSPPAPLRDWSGPELARLPAYYVHRQDQTMAQAVAPHEPSQAPDWLPDAELAVYAAEYARTGFQGGLNWYRGRTTGRHARELSLYAGRVIDVPAAFVAGAADWGTVQSPGAAAAMRAAFPRMGPPNLIDGAGHWVQQEAPEAVTAHLLAALRAG